MQARGAHSRAQAPQEGVDAAQASIFPIRREGDAGWDGEVWETLQVHGPVVGTEELCEARCEGVGVVL